MKNTQINCGSFTIVKLQAISRRLISRRLIAIIALAAVIGFTMGCEPEPENTGRDENPYAGTWRSQEGGGYYVLVIRDFPQTFTITSPTGQVESGTWSGFANDPVITLTITNGGSGSYNVSISGNTLSFGSRTYTKS